MKEISYEEKLKLWKSAYSKILKVCENYPDFKEFGFHDIDDMKRKAKNHLILIEWYEKYGLELSHSLQPYERNYLSVNDYMGFLRFKDAEECKEKGNGCLISWPDDGRQPEDGWYLQISFSTGAFIFGDDYNGQQQLFQDFFQELKSYNPDHSDSHNCSLYWKIENAKAIYDGFRGILEKYYQRNREELNTRRAAKLRAELEKLETGKIN